MNANGRKSIAIESFEWSALRRYPDYRHLQWVKLCEFGAFEVQISTLIRVHSRLIIQNEGALPSPGFHLDATTRVQT
jgi:hypothetical protein